MTKLIKLSDFEGDTKKLKPVEFTHYYNSLLFSKNWIDAELSPSYYKTVVHIGYHDSHQFDYFIAFDSPDRIHHYRGHLNDGVI